MTRVAILDDFQNVALRLADWSEVAKDAEITVFSDNLRETERVVERLRPFDIIVAMRERTPFSRERLEALRNLRLLVTTGMWNRAIDVVAATERGIVVCGTESSRHAPVELTWALILGLARHVAAEDASMRAGGWQSTLGVELHGKTLGVLGLGRLGTEIARIGQAFGMRCIAWSQNLTAERCAQLGVAYASKDDFFASSDILTIHVVLSDRTRGLIGRDELATMKRTALLVNTSRGAIVDTEALLAALHAGAIGGVAIDVYDEEPLPHAHPLRHAPRTLLTPHIGITTEDNYRTYYTQAVEDILAFTRGKPIRVLNGRKTSQRSS